MLRYWASLERAVSNEKAPISAQLFGNRVGTDSPALEMWLPEHSNAFGVVQGLLQNCDVYRKSKAGSQLCPIREQCHSILRDREKSDFGAFWNARPDRDHPKSPTKSEYFQTVMFRSEVECRARSVLDESRHAYTSADLC
jgi:hypothetical protein